MKPNELFNHLWNKSDYTKSKMDLDWDIEINDELKLLVLVFEETVSKYDWKINFMFPVRAYKHQEHKILVHKGWKDVWKANNDEIMSALNKEKIFHPGYKTMICGYSYGGAVSQLAAEDYCYRTGNQVDYLITFGSPKPLFGRKTRDYFRSCVKFARQYSCVNDLVTYCIPLPFYTRISTDKVGKRKLFSIFNPKKWHTSYGDESYYDEEILK